MDGVQDQRQPTQVDGAVGGLDVASTGIGGAGQAQSVPGGFSEDPTLAIHSNADEEAERSTSHAHANSALLSDGSAPGVTSIAASAKSVPNGVKESGERVGASESESKEEVAQVVPSSSEPAAVENDSPHLLVIESLRTQVSDLITQVTQLNAKLVKSYDRVSDLEDDLHVTSANLRASTLRVSQLELERTEHLSALNTGLLVEKSHVTTELTRLMERATDEAAQRGKAETARAEIEKELDDLSAALFSQANSMVAEARLDKARSLRRLAECEEALKGAEDIVGMLQQQMQGLREEKDQGDKELESMRDLVGKGKFVEKEKEMVVMPLRLMSSHLPYKEFLDFIGHLRSIRPTAQQPPAISTLLTLPLLARLASEDSDSTVRLDLAPSLNWLTRRSFTSAIQQGLLLIEPLHTTSLAAEAVSQLVSASSPDVLCALCGCAVFPSQGATTPRHGTSTPPVRASLPTNKPVANTTNSWSTSRFLKNNPLTASLNPSRGSLPASSLSVSASPAPPTLPDAIIFVFRLSSPSSQKPANPYPLCQSGWCLTRLRTTCELWQFVRRGIVDRVWEGEMVAGERTPPPALPPRKRMPSKIGFWGMGSASGSDVNVANRSGTSTPAEEKPPLPRRHTDITSALPAPSEIRRRVPPPYVPTHDSTSTGAPKGADGHITSLEQPNGDSSSGTAHSTEVASDATVTSEAPLSIPAIEVAEAPQELSAGETQTEAAVSSPSESLQHTPVDTSTVELSASAVADGLSTTPVQSVQSTEQEVDSEPLSSEPAAHVNEELSSEAKAIEPPPAPVITEALTSSAEAQPYAADADPSTPPRRTSVESPVTPSSVPPPIPRRAAARVRGTPSAPSPGSSPTKEATSLPTEDHMRLASYSSPATEQDDDFMSAPSSPKSKPNSPSTAKTQLRDSDVPSLTSTEQEHEDEKAEINGIGIEDKTLPLVSTLPHPIDRPAVPPPPPRRQAPPTFDSFTSNPPSSQTADLSFGTDGAAFVGDRTWEEKAWRELVKLREDMFLARVGAVRPSQADL